MPEEKVGGARTYLAAATILALIFGIGWAALSTYMLWTFHQSIWDLGANYVLTHMSAPPNLDYGHLRFAPQNLIYLAFTPLTWAFPAPMVLVYAEDALMAVGGVFVFLIAREAWQNSPRALLVEGLYLFNYALFGAPYYPNHYEILFAVFFPIAYYLHLRHHDLGMVIFLTLAALTSSLGSVMAGLFVGLLLGPRFLQELRGHGLGLRRFLADHWHAVAGGAVAVGIFALPFALQGPSITLSYSHLAGGPTSPNLLGGLTSDPVEKVTGLFLILLPFLATLHRSRYFVMAAPYVPLALLSKQDHLTQFTYQYVYVIGAALFIAWIEALRPRYARCARPLLVAAAPDVPSPGRPRWHLPAVTHREPELVAFGAIVTGLGLVALPYSPLNAYAGPYYSLPFHDYNFPGLVTVTPYDRALSSMADKVPMNASVLIQENMPVLANRGTWYEPGSYEGEPVDFVLTDPTSFWFYYPPPPFIGPYSTPMINWVNPILNNGSYGIVEEYESAMLLERGYHGASTFVPYESYEPGVAFRGSNATFPGVPSGVAHVDRLLGSAPQLKTNGVEILPPGQFQLTFWVSANGANPSDRLTFGLWTNATPTSPLVTTNISGAALAADGQWTPIVLGFALHDYQDGVYFALSGDWPVGLSLESVYLNQTSLE